MCGILPKKCHVAPSPLATQMTPLAARGIAHSTHWGWGDYVWPTFHLLRIFQSRRLPPDGREVRFNFLSQTCPDPLATLTRSASAADDSDSPDNLTRQTLAICRIHFCPRSRSKLRQHCRPSLLNYHSSSIQDTLDKTFLNLLRLPDAFSVSKIIN